MGSDGLLDEFDIVGDECINHLDCLFRRPSSIGINTDNCRRDLTNGLEVLKIVLRPNLDLEDRVVTSQ